MYGTIARFQPKPGKEQQVVAMFEEWDREQRPQAKGALGTYLFRLDRGGMMAVAVFQDRASYFANAERPGQDHWYRKLRELLEADPEWNDGEVLGPW